MTYCVGMLLDAGLVFLSDSRTNAGVDHISSFRKITVYERPGDRVMVLLSSGNLAITQSLVSILRERLAAEQGTPNLYNVPNMFEAARCVGDVLREVFARDAEALKQFNIEFNAAFILGGQIHGEPPRLFSIYAAGNFIEATVDTPFFQIGEHKYGKPILDRVARNDMKLGDAAKMVLLSFDSTLRSNLSVGLPIDLLTYERGTLKIEHTKRIGLDDPYFKMLSTEWSKALRTAFMNIEALDI